MRHEYSPSSSGKICAIVIDTLSPFTACLNSSDDAISRAPWCHVTVRPGSLLLLLRELDDDVTRHCSVIDSPSMAMQSFSGSSRRSAGDDDDDDDDVSFLDGAVAVHANMPMSRSHITWWCVKQTHANHMTCNIDMRCNSKAFWTRDCWTKCAECIVIYNRAHKSTQLYNTILRRLIHRKLRDCFASLKSRHRI